MLSTSGRGHDVGPAGGKKGKLMSKEDMLARMAQAIIDGRKEDAQALA